MEEYYALLDYNLAFGYLGWYLVSRMSDMDTLTDKDLVIIDQFVIRMYDKPCPVNNVNQCRHILYTRKRRNIEGIPPTQNSIIQQIKRAMLQSKQLNKII